MLALMLGLAAMLAPEAIAQDLYAPPPPPGSAFVRVVAVDGEGAAEVGGKAAGRLQSGQASRFFVVPEGQRTVSVGPQEHEARVEAGRYYTVALAGAATTLVEDPRHTQLAKAELVLYNFSDAPEAELRTADGATPVITGVAPASRGQRVVNAVSVPLGVFVGGEPVGSLVGLELERGQSTSVFLTGDADELRVTWSRNQVE